ncbi:hypothetical protein [Dickeya undicola]|nr:hypothetical protein [Dickeya undicola]
MTESKQKYQVNASVWLCQPFASKETEIMVEDKVMVQIPYEKGWGRAV